MSTRLDAIPVPPGGELTVPQLRPSQVNSAKSYLRRQWYRPLRFVTCDPLSSFFACSRWQFATQACRWIRRLSLAYDHSPRTLHLLSFPSPSTPAHVLFDETRDLRPGNIYHLYQHFATPCARCPFSVPPFVPPLMVVVKKEYLMLSCSSKHHCPRVACSRRAPSQHEVSACRAQEPLAT